jgi:hypothetical protein
VFAADQGCCLEQTRSRSNSESVPSQGGREIEIVRCATHSQIRLRCGTPSDAASDSYAAFLGPSATLLS